MCKFASFVATKGRLLWLADSDSHEDIITHHKLRDGWFVRLELLPPDNDPRRPVDEWVFRVDQDCLPVWFNHAVEEAACRRELPALLAVRVHAEGTHEVTQGRHYFYGNSTGNVSGGGHYFYDNSTGSVSGGEAVFHDNAMGSISGGKAAFHGNSMGSVSGGQAWFYDNSTGSVSGGEAVFHDNSKKIGG